jgi:hypothetical protein
MFFRLDKVTQILATRKFAEVRADGQISRSATYCMRFRLLDLLAHGEVELDLTTPHMRGRHSFRDLTGLVQASSDDLFLEVRGTLVAKVASTTKLDGIVVSRLLLDVERQWLASRIRLLDTFDPLTSKRSWVSDSTIAYVRVILLQDGGEAEQGKGQYKWEICPEYQLPSDCDDLRLQLLFNTNKDYHAKNGVDQSFKTLFNTLRSHLDAKVKIYVSVSSILSSSIDGEEAEVAGLGEDRRTPYCCYSCADGATSTLERAAPRVRGPIRAVPITSEDHR